MYDTHHAPFLTWLRHVCDIHTLLMRHEAEHRENGESCHETGATVEETQSETVPETQTQSWNEIKINIRYASSVHQCLKHVWNHTKPIGWERSGDKA